MFQKALALEPNSEAAHLNLAMALRETGDLDPEAIPVELGIQVLDPNEKAGQATEPGKAATPAPSATATPSATPEEGDGGGSGFALVIPGVAGLLIGAAGGFLAVRRRRSA